MKRISDIDKNFSVPAPKEGDLTYLNAAEPPFSLYGLMREEGWYCRLPVSIARQVNDGTVALHKNTSGGRVRFATDSSVIALKVDMPFSLPMPHMPLTGSGGFDLYQDGVFIRAFIPPMDEHTPYIVEAPIYTQGVHEYEINFPLYHDVKDVYVGLKPDSVLRPGRPYAHALPAVFYGSSITQGGCASRPGMNYANILSRQLDLDFVNLGFSGNARGETAMADYISDLPMSVFVCDYDHNAPTLEHLQKTHLPFVTRFRDAQPDTPLILITRPDIHFPRPDNVPQRRDVIYASYRFLLNRGDTKVWFIDGGAFFAGPEADGCTVDGAHPTDLGFFRMASVVRPVLEEALGVR